MIWYFLIGIVWSAWLEYCSTKYRDLESIDYNWTMFDRIRQIVFWPINLIVFIVAFFKGVNDGE